MTVSRLRDQFRDWVEQQYGSERVRLIDIVERARRDGDLQIGRSIGHFENGIFEAASASDMAVVAVAITTDGQRSPIPPEMPEVPEASGGVDVMWQEQSVTGIYVWMGKTT